MILKIFLAALSPMLVMFTCIAAGYALRNVKGIPENTASVLSKLENSLLVPCVCIESFMEKCTLQSLREGSRIMLYSSLLLALALLLSGPVSRLFSPDNRDLRNIYRYALVVANCGFMGLPLVPMILGEEQVYSYMMMWLPVQIVCYTWGYSTLIPAGKTGEASTKADSLKRALNPPMISIVIGVLLGLTGGERLLPSFLKTAISNLADCMGPLAMIITGFTVAGYKLKEIIGNKKIYAVTALRLLILPALFCGLLLLIGAGKDIAALALIAFGTPLGLYTVVVPAAYGGETKTGASMTIISNTLCVITIPLMYALLMSLPV